MNENIAGVLAKKFIRHPLTLMLSVFILAMGYVSLQSSSREANPQIVVAGGTVLVPYPGVKADEIQNLVIKPLERRLQEIPNVENIYGIAQDNMAIFNIQFYLGTDSSKADFDLYNSVMRNLDALPKGILQPIVKTFSIDSDIAVASVAFYSKNKNMDIVELHRKVIPVQHQINRIKDVALTDFIGERKEQFNVLVDLHKLSAYNLSLAHFIKAVEGVTLRVPDMKGHYDNNKIILFGVKKEIENVKDIENIQIANSVYIRDVAKVEKDIDIQNYKSALIRSKEMGMANEQEQITLTVSKRKGANVVEINNQINDLLETMKPQFEKEGIGYIITRDDGYTANHSVNELVLHIIISVIIIGILLILQLGYKEAFIVTLTVPMIISLTLLSGYALGLSINKISLFALLLSLGILVDAAIIVIENIHRHFHDHDSKDKSVAEIAIAATNEVGNPTNLATVAIMITFLSIFLVGGTIGQYIRPLAIFTPIALFASLLVAYIFTPYFVNKIMTKRD
ncbi:acriflavin resistance protein (plasmid) [Sulfuricurvum kujiense DSM 16994]|uniref:Acriflavin resistance protein n=1 Tax=Sulfuricurvum kujiense (strain ATCC BAA-921 / DSM 16994 / JCM 11577 / YK-1) TaxID=709032 RepID=E4U3M9_SULKY|nr:efflux RND transporter permease subunit [Sulfuricurvum kujiense]ADR35295.1 acriflavin resistance protein [Sulfuricurvum kujiense DSM 16994]